MSRELRVGLLGLAALAVLAMAIFLVGERRNLFARTASYSVRFTNVGGLSPGNPVQLNGVNVGQVEEVVLPEQVDESQLTVWISVDRRYASRVRSDSLARIKTLGLLGDKYVEISSGSPGSPAIPSGGEIPAAPATDLDKMIASGEDLVENVLAIAVSLRTILTNMQQGRGMLGQLLTDDATVTEAKANVVSSLASLQRILEAIERGDGTLGTLVRDDTLATRLEESLTRFEGVLGTLEEGEGALPALLNDPATRERVTGLIDRLESTAEAFAAFAGDLEQGDGLLNRLLRDEQYGEEMSRELRELLERLNSLTGKLESGEGTLGRIITDPSLYEAVDQIVVGINESKLLRWLIRNRQKAGIKKQVQEEKATQAAGEAGSGR